MNARSIPRVCAATALLALSACASMGGTGGHRILTANRLSTYQIDVLPNGHGSGVVLANSPDGAYLLTCSHVVHDQKNIEVSVIDHTGPASCKAKIVFDDPTEDLAVLKVACRFPQTVVLGPVSGPKVGDRLYNVGYPFDFGEMYGEGYVQKEKFSGIVLTENGPIMLKETILANIPDGSGTSGSGVYSAETGALIGIMEGAYHKGGPIVGVTARLVIPMSRVRPLLDKHKIPYEAIDAK